MAVRVGTKDVPTLRVPTGAIPSVRPDLALLVGLEQTIYE